MTRQASWTKPRKFWGNTPNAQVCGAATGTGEDALAIGQNLAYRLNLVAHHLVWKRRCKFWERCGAIHLDAVAAQLLIQWIAVSKRDSR